MQEISELIIELLKTHNRVSLPGMGAFVATPQPAIINPTTKSITPPSKKIAFSKVETWNDGLLEQLYAERRNMSVDEARDRLRITIADMRFELDATGKLVLSGLGTLRQSQARDINFGLDKNLNLKTDSYGLGEVKIEPSANTFRVKKEKDILSSTATDNNLPQLILLGVMLFIISALLLYLFLNRNSKDDPTNPQPPAPQEAVTEVVTKPQEPQRIVHTPPQQPAKAPAKTPTAAPKPQPQPQPAAASSSRCEYCVVANSLSTHEGAKLKSNSYKQMGYKSEVIQSGNNRYRVTIGCYRDGEVAKQELRKAQKLISDAWVLEVCR